jgi:hypothetical protein
MSAAACLIAGAYTSSPFGVNFSEMTQTALSPRLSKLLFV